MLHHQVVVPIGDEFLAHAEHLLEKAVFLRVKVLEELPEQLFLVFVVVSKLHVFGHFVKHILCKVYCVLVTEVIMEPFPRMLEVLLLDVEVQDFKHVSVENGKLFDRVERKDA